MGKELQPDNVFMGTRLIEDSWKTWRTILEIWKTILVVPTSEDALPCFATFSSPALPFEPAPTNSTKRQKVGFKVGVKTFTRTGARTYEFSRPANEIKVLRLKQEIEKTEGWKPEHFDLIYNGVGLEHGASIRYYLTHDKKAIGLGDVLLEKFPERLVPAKAGNQ